MANRKVEVFERRRRQTDVVTMPIPMQLPKATDPIWKLGQHVVALLCQYLDGP